MSVLVSLDAQNIILVGLEHSAYTLAVGMLLNDRKNAAAALLGLISCLPMPCAPGDGIVGRAGVQRLGCPSF